MTQQVQWPVTESVRIHTGWSVCEVLYSLERPQCGTTMRGLNDAQCAQADRDATAQQLAEARRQAADAAAAAERAAAAAAVECGTSEAAALEAKAAELAALRAQLDRWPICFFPACASF